MKDFLRYAGYFRASRYGKYLLTQVNVFGSKADSKIFFELYEVAMSVPIMNHEYDDLILTSEQEEQGRNVINLWYNK